MEKEMFTAMEEDEVKSKLDQQSAYLVHFAVPVDLVGSVPIDIEVEYRVEIDPS